VKVRYKTYSQFISGIRIVHRDNGGVNIVCKRGNYVVEKLQYKPWNSADTKRTWFIKFYCKRILGAFSISKKIARIEGFELLGARCLYRDTVCIICNSEDYVDPETGEVIRKLTMYSDILQHPFTAFETEVQL